MGVKSTSIVILFTVRNQASWPERQLIIGDVQEELSLALSIKYCDVFGRMPSLLSNLKSDTPVVARQPKVKHLHGYARDSVLSRCMVA
jgi:hypothetical protein